jgi:ABC-type oligopeptide transport system substrate-binding subunit
VLGTRDFFPQSVPVGRYFADLLNDLGYHSTFKVVPGNAYISALYDPSRRPDMAFLAWQTDYLAESGFILPTLSCKGNGNASGFCDPALDRRMKAAARVQLTDAAAARQRWSSIEHEIVDRAVWLPLVNAYWVNLVSQRVGNFQVNPQMGPLVDQMWVR